MLDFEGTQVRWQTKETQEIIEDVWARDRDEGWGCVAANGALVGAESALGQGVLETAFGEALRVTGSDLKEKKTPAT